MILSMTGYGRAEQVLNGRSIQVELRSVNSRYFEYSSRLPRSCSFMEDKLKKLMSKSISRGKALMLPTPWWRWITRWPKAITLPCRA